MAKKVKKDPDKLVRKHFRRDCSKGGVFTPNQTTTLRAILDRTSQGLPINAKIAKHTPLPPDGNNLEDFETGTEQYIDIADAVPVLDKLEQLEQQQQQRREDERKKAFDDAVEAEVAKRLAQSQAPQVP